MLTPKSTTSAETGQPIMAGEPVIQPEGQGESGEGLPF